MLQQQHQHYEVSGQTYRTITETVLVPVDGVEPEWSHGNVAWPSPSGSAAQPAEPPPTTPTREPPSEAGIKTAPASTAPPGTDRQAPPPAPRAQGAATAPTSPASAQADLARRFNAVMGRALRAKSALTQWQRTRGAGGALPDEISVARNHMDAALVAAATAMRVRDNAQAAESLNAAEEALAVVERFLAK